MCMNERASRGNGLEWALFSRSSRCTVHCRLAASLFPPAQLSQWAQLSSASCETMHKQRRSACALCALCSWGRRRSRANVNAAAAAAAAKAGTERERQKGEDKRKKRFRSFAAGDSTRESRDSATRVTCSARSAAAAAAPSSCRVSGLSLSQSARAGSFASSLALANKRAPFCFGLSLSLPSPLRTPPVCLRQPPPPPCVH